MIAAVVPASHDSSVSPATSTHYSARRLRLARSEFVNESGSASDWGTPQTGRENRVARAQHLSSTHQARMRSLTDRAHRRSAAALLLILFLGRKKNAVCDDWRPVCIGQIRGVNDSGERRNMKMDEPSGNQSGDAKDQLPQRYHRCRGMSTGTESRELAISVGTARVV